MSNESRLEALLEEAIIDCYDEEEELMGVLITLNERLVWPLTAQWADQSVEVLGLGESASSLHRGIVANVRDGREYTIGLADLTFVDLDETSAEWLAMSTGGRFHRRQQYWTCFNLAITVQIYGGFVTQRIQRL